MCWIIVKPLTRRRMPCAAAIAAAIQQQGAAADAGECEGCDLDIGVKRIRPRALLCRYATFACSRTVRITFTATLCGIRK